ncbi:hypothetical protein T190115A13A_50003 [Tenacibaculum sp. 190524A02b]|uniref:Uncharacterized protein n=1 Tax=Tenacibaculum vairaonense TaxID=3137860 RepID=A0ABM9PPR8_9FLAO
MKSNYTLEKQVVFRSPIDEDKIGDNTGGGGSSGTGDGDGDGGR